MEDSGHLEGSVISLRAELLSLRTGHAEVLVAVTGVVDVSVAIKSCGGAGSATKSCSVAQAMSLDCLNAIDVNFYCIFCGETWRSISKSILCWLCIHNLSSPAGITCICK